MPRVDEILTQYGQMIENVLSGQGKVGAILRRNDIIGSLEAGRPSTIAAQPQYSPGLPDMSGAPQNANESLSDLMTFVGSLGSGAVGDPNEGVNWAGIDAQRASRAVDVQGLMDDRATQQADMINQSNLQQDQINSELGQAGAAGRINADQVELGGAQLQQQQQNAIDDLIAHLEAEKGEQSRFDRELASDQAIAQMQFGNRPPPLTFEQQLQIAGRTGERQSKLLTPDEEAQKIRMDIAGRAPAGSGRPLAPETFGSPIEGTNRETGERGYFRPGNRGSMKFTDITPEEGDTPSIDRTAPEKRPGGKPKAPMPKSGLKESEAKNTMHLGQMLGASAELERLEKSGVDPGATSSQISSSVAGGPLRGFAGAEGQQLRQIENQWTSAFLYARTGQAATADEVAKNSKTFFPQIGEGEEVIAQKARARNLAENGVRTAAGRGAEQLKPPVASASSVPDSNSVEAEMRRRGLLP